MSEEYDEKEMLQTAARYATQLTAQLMTAREDPPLMRELVNQHIQERSDAGAHVHEVLVTLLLTTVGGFQLAAGSMRIMRLMKPGVDLDELLRQALLKAQNDRPEHFFGK